MAKFMRRCRVCGNEYAVCSSIRTGSATFNWREVACSPECGQLYFELIKESRTVPNQDSSHKAKKANKKEPPVAERIDGITPVGNCECE